MEYDAIDWPDSVEIHVPGDDDYRTCSECGDDCPPNPYVTTDEAGVRIAFVCPAHGLRALVDPFEDTR